MNERQTLRVLAWVFGGLVFSVFVLDMIAMSQTTLEVPGQSHLASPLPGGTPHPLSSGSSGTGNLSDPRS